MSAHRSFRGWAYGAYLSMPTPLTDVGEKVLTWRAERTFAANRPMPAAERRLLIGPLNTAGQAQRWSRAAETLPHTAARNVCVQRRVATTTGFNYPADWHLSRAVQLRGMAPYRSQVLNTTHVLAESAWALLDDVFERWISDDLPALRARGVKVGVIVHGSELRDLHRHAQTELHSPFRGGWDERWHRLQRTVERTRNVLADSGLPVFVTTADMLDYAPTATLLPLVVDTQRFASVVPVLQRSRPIILHAPSNPRLKGTAVIDAVLSRLRDEGLVDYRRLGAVPHSRMPEMIGSADIVVDQIVLGNVGVLAAEAMAAGRLVIAHVPAGVRDRTPGLPVLEADPDTLEEVIRTLCRGPAHHGEVAAEGPGWVRRHHSGTATAAVLNRWLS